MCKVKFRVLIKHGRDNHTLSTLIIKARDYKAARRQAWYKFPDADIKNIRILKEGRA